MTAQTIIFLGPQGSGKGTQASILVKQLDGVFLEMGDLLRQTAQADSEFGKYIKDMVDNGILVPDQDVERVLSDKLDHLQGDKNVIFDGVPRRMGQAEFLISELKKHDRTDIHTIYITLDREESLKRLLIRKVCVNCKSPSHAEDLISCQLCGGEWVQRKDDNEEAINRRLDQFENETLPVIEYLRDITNLHEIDGKQSIEAVSADIRKALNLE
jgi:adenylate kinase